jgi:predicted glycogen debranching enzyme
MDHPMIEAMHATELALGERGLAGHDEVMISPLPIHAMDLTVDDLAPTPMTSSIEREWLLTNGLGGFAMGTPSAINTRRYHSLLVASPNPPLNRISTLGAVNTILETGGARYEIDAHEFASPQGSVFHPQGWRHLREFSRTAAACTWTYHRCGPIRVTRELRLVWKRQLAVMTWRIESALPAGRRKEPVGPVTIQLQPLVALRDFHHHRRADSDGGFHVEASGGRLVIATPGLPPLHVQIDAGQFIPGRDWWRNFKHRCESARWQDDIEDLFVPGVFTHTFQDPGRSGGVLRMAFGIEPIDWKILHGDDGRSEHWADLVRHVRRQVPRKAASESLHALTLASDDFVTPRIVKGQPAATILAGYPWFSDWGRDTMISLPGLLLATGRFEEARHTLFTFAQHLRRGLVPNRFDDYGGDPHYNTVDAPLWFVHAALEYLRLSGDEQAWGDLLSGACAAILDAFADGTDYDIRMDADGLISAGSPDTQLTWMDAKNSGVAFTPRFGKAVEINALWHRALAGCAEAMKRTDRKAAARFRQRAATAKKSFAACFWNPAGQCLFDHVTPAGPDPALRPNQVLAVSLPLTPLTAAQRKKVMLAVRQSLLTPMGLRTLPPGDPNYHARYTGSMFDRDRAYHQGTVWPWLIGPYVEGWLRANDFTDDARAHARAALAPLLEHLMNTGLGQLPEIAEADAPHRPDGCAAQAWSVAETLRAALLIDAPAPE